MIKEVESKAGFYLEVNFLPFKKVPRVRAKKYRPTKAAQEHLNQVNREREIYMLLHENFTPNDYAFHTDYSDDFLPKNIEEAENNRKNFIRRLKRIYNNNQIELKAFYVTEEAGRFHNHMVISGGVEPKLIKQAWGMGLCRCDKLEFSERGIIGLAKYYVKQKKNNNGETTRRSFGCTRNLKRPKPAKEKVISKATFQNLFDDFENRKLWETRYKDYFLVEVSKKENPDFKEKYIDVRMCHKDAPLSFINDINYNGGMAIASVRRYKKKKENVKNE